MYIPNVIFDTPDMISTGQEPGTNEEIAQYVKSKFGVEFQIMDKIEVNGPKASPVYKVLKVSL